MNNKKEVLVLEGTDGVGKTELTKQLLKTIPNSVSFASLGGSELSMKIRELIMTNGHLKEQCSPSFVLLMLAAIQDVIDNQVLPALNEGKTVIMDRGWLSTFVYNIAPYPYHSIKTMYNFWVQSLNYLVRDNSINVFCLTILPVCNIEKIINRSQIEKNHFDTKDTDLYLQRIKNYESIPKDQGYIRYQRIYITGNETIEEMIIKIKDRWNN